MWSLIDERDNALQKHENMKGQEVTGAPCVYELSKFAQFNLSDLFSAKEVLDFGA